MPASAPSPVAIASPPAEAAGGPSGSATVMVDIGGDAGALVVWTSAALQHAEIEIRRVGAPWSGTHTAVRPRTLPGGTRWAALFGTLPAGEYELRVCRPTPVGRAGSGSGDESLHLHEAQGDQTDRAGLPVCKVRVVGAVTEIWWPAHSRAAGGVQGLLGEAGAPTGVRAVAPAPPARCSRTGLRGQDR